ncbi:gamma-D-glutamyl-L-lysine endopeptidase [Oceanobacillus oncorhynchi subsp. incaldanensis]|uniref:Gamma-D-glutamyl-L-lysine endopeptidase n=1 Tax=Oceanobacillus oncorhynchi TaxID=545501 RepID=A0A0A1MP10_9BACI|nr:C40 family peptidase [Oceanobacillus oncorhynchi]GIO20127.1 gamma-D-glutamyl-L-lysine endopeptidase [Oceanobacillus oncorhynchi subsp. incaldanensis]CEI80791.1 Gamma-D-glutamyl-L-lysine endopeptidase [Oceanobacillus oncorhynchi]
MQQLLKELPKTFHVTNVQAATIWTNPQAARAEDKDGTSHPTDILKWVNSLTYEESLALCNENRVQSQTLYGEPVIVLEEEGDWAHVIAPFQPSKKDSRGYPGYIPLRQLTSVDKEAWLQDKYIVVKTDNAWLEDPAKDTRIQLSYLTILPYLGEREAHVYVQTPSGKQQIAKEKTVTVAKEDGIKQGSGADIVTAALPFIGLDYFWGGMSSFGYDCSGLAYAAHKANGYWIARDAGDQARAGEEIAIDALKPGDLLFFAYQEGKGAIHHVGIYKGNGEMLHSPQTGKGVEITPLKGTEYEKELCAARRYWR